MYESLSIQPNSHRESLRDYIVAAVTFIGVVICFYYDSNSDIELQNALGVYGWITLLCLLYGQDKKVKAQVVIAIAFATFGEYFASVIMRGYIYRFENVPAYVPPGHGMVYLTAVILARSYLFVRFTNAIIWVVLGMGSVWAIWGILFASRSDGLGGVLFVVFVVCVFYGRSPRVYLGAFFITSWLELVGTYLGTWEWAIVDPVSGLTQGNPPSGVAAWYCLVDAVALAGAPIILGWFDRSEAEQQA